MEIKIADVVKQIRNSLKNGEYTLPKNAQDLKELGKHFGWTEAHYQDARRQMFPTPEENAALSAKFMKMM
jgi:hypothetical protein